MSAPEILATLAANDPAAFVEHIMPVVREAQQQAAPARSPSTVSTTGRSEAPGPRSGPSMIRLTLSSAG